MKSIYQVALGSDFAKLHPKIQRRFGFSSEDGIAAIYIVKNPDKLSHIRAGRPGE